jgi:hypothetical protein
MWGELIVFLLTAAFAAVMLFRWARSLRWIDWILRRVFRLDEDDLMSWGQSQVFLLVTMLAMLLCAVSTARLLFAFMNWITA